MESLDKTNLMANPMESYSYEVNFMLGAKYKRVEIEEMVEENCNHLDAKQKEDSKALMPDCFKLFDRTIDKYSGEPMHIKLEKML